MHGTSIFSLCACVALASACASNRNDDASVGNAGELNGGVCKKASELPLVDPEEDIDTDTKHAYGQYVAATGVTIPFDVPVYAYSEDGHPYAVPASRSPVVGSLTKETRTDAFSDGSGKFMRIWDENTGLAGFVSAAALGDPVNGLPRASR